MDKESLRNKINSYHHNTVPKKVLMDWTKTLPKKIAVKPMKVKKGDVFMHPIFQHPYILLYKKEDYWVCGLFTSNGDFEEVLEKCRSRFFSESYITKVLFTVKNPIGGFMAVYDNNRHLDKVSEKLKECMIN